MGTETDRRKLCCCISQEASSFRVPALFRDPPSRSGAYGNTFDLIATFLKNEMVELDKYRETRQSVIVIDASKRRWSQFVQVT